MRLPSTLSRISEEDSIHTSANHPQNQKILQLCKQLISNKTWEKEDLNDPNRNRALGKNIVSIFFYLCFIQSTRFSNSTERKLNGILLSEVCK